MACRHQNASNTTWYEVRVLPCPHKSHVWVEGDYVDHEIKNFASSKKDIITYRVTVFVSLQASTCLGCTLSYPSYYSKV